MQQVENISPKNILRRVKYDRNIIALLGYILGVSVIKIKFQ